MLYYVVEAQGAGCGAFARAPKSPKGWVIKCLNNILFVYAARSDVLLVDTTNYYVEKRRGWSSGE